MDISVLMGVKHQRLTFETLRSRGDVQRAYPKLTGSTLLRRNYTGGNSHTPDNRRAATHRVLRSLMGNPEVGALAGRWNHRGDGQSPPRAAAEKVGPVPLNRTCRAGSQQA